MKDQLINERGEEEAKELIQRRRDQGKEDFRDKYVENKEIWDKVAKSNEPNLLAEIMPGLFLGVTREFGTDLPEDQTGQKIDTETSVEKIMKELSNKKYEAPLKYVPPKDTIRIPEGPIQVKTTSSAVTSKIVVNKKKLADEVTA